jgi:cell division FtsZ-interacting protein ZapD
MKAKTYQISLNFEQILEVVNQLPLDEKLRLSKELEKETVERKLTELLETFKTDELDLETINEEVEAVRAELYGKSEAN